MNEDSYILYIYLCWENGVLQLVSEQVGLFGQVVESRSVVNSWNTIFMLF